MEAAIMQRDEELMDKDIFDQQVKKEKLERALLQLHHKTLQRSELSEEIKIIKEEINDLYIDVELPAVLTQSEDGTYICIQEKTIEKDVFDKDALALELNLDKKEIAKPWDFSFLTFKGKLNPKMIAKHTHNETSKDIKISRTKRNPLKKGKNKRFKKSM